MLATDSVEYYVPFALPQGAAEAVVVVKNVAADALCWDSIKVADTFDTTNRDKFRPVYHHTPLYGWMNDANGLVYKDGEYHLYFQYNPYGSVWGNMHWGHSVSKDLVHWEHLDPAIARDTLGHIFSGSAIVDKHNSAGYGENTMVAFYTSASDKNGQIQCMAYSTDNGRTYTKYGNNPILTPFDGLKDFRDPKVFWYEPDQKWVMVVSADKEMRFYSSRNLKDWEFMSGFGEGYGVQPSQFECPDFIQLPVDGDKNRMKWALIVNINPGCMFGGSATQYFIGDFDGKEFKCDTKPEVTKWLDVLTLAQGIQLAIVNKRTQVLMGDIYLRQQCDVFWLGYTISPAYAREGYAFQVITATIGWIKENGFSLIKAGVNPENNLSIKLLIKTGFNFSGIEEGEHIYVLDLTKGE